MLSDDNITREKTEINLRNNPHTTFLCPSNATANTINNHAIDILLEKDQPIRHVVNPLKAVMPYTKTWPL